MSRALAHRLQKLEAAAWQALHPNGIVCRLIDGRVH
jgi:hypothetical protein